MMAQKGREVARVGPPARIFLQQHAGSGMHPWHVPNSRRLPGKNSTVGKGVGRGARFSTCRGCHFSQPARRAGQQAFLAQRLASRTGFTTRSVACARQEPALLREAQYLGTYSALQACFPCTLSPLSMPPPPDNPSSPRLKQNNDSSPTCPPPSAPGDSPRA
jgi:hypothetical protein